MQKFSRSPARVRVLIALPVLLGSALIVAACGDDDPAWPSNAAVQELRIQKVPAGAPSLIIETYGDSLRLLGVPVDAEGVWVDQPVTWTSSNPSVADVVVHTGADGRAYGVLRFAASPSYVNPTNVDTVTVTATSGSHTSEIQVIVREDPRVETVSVTSVSPFLPIGASANVTATPRDGFGNTIEAPNPWEWATSSTNVATVADNEDGTATVTMQGVGSAAVSAAVANAGEDPAVGTVTGTTDITVLPALSAGTTLIGNISSGAFSMWIVEVPQGASRLLVELSGDTTGDADLMVHAPGAALFAYTCGRFTGSSDEICDIASPAAGWWGVVVEAWEGAPNVTGISVTISFN